MRCIICVKHSPILSPPDWIALKTFKTSHQRAATHLRCVELQIKENAAEENRRRIENEPGYFAILNNTTSTIVSSHQLATNHRQSTNHMKELWDQFDGTFELDHGAEEVHKSAREDFMAKAHEYGLQDGAEAIADEDMSNIEQLWDDEVQDDLLSELLEQIGMLEVPSELRNTDSQKN